jgi:hypothetical protein
LLIELCSSLNGPLSGSGGLHGKISTQVRDNLWRFVRISEGEGDIVAGLILINVLPGWLI